VLGCPAAGGTSAEQLRTYTHLLNSRLVSARHFVLSHGVTRHAPTIICINSAPPHMQVLSEGLLHTVFANEEEAAAVLKAAAAHQAPGSRDAADSDQEASGGSGGAPSEQRLEHLHNGHSHPADGHSTSADCSAAPAQQGQVHDEAAAAAQRWLLQYCQVAVVSLGPRGCMAQDQRGGTAACAADRCAKRVCCSEPTLADGAVCGDTAAGQHVRNISGRDYGHLLADWHHCCWVCCRVVVQDSVGAGDSFSAGWLAGYLAGAPLAACAAAGCAAGTAAVQAVGGIPDDKAQAALRKRIAALLQERGFGQCSGRRMQ
jgi:pfkB family carbohydrate kinase